MVSDYQKYMKKATTEGWHHMRNGNSYLIQNGKIKRCIKNHGMESAGPYLYDANIRVYIDCSGEDARTFVGGLRSGRRFIL